MQFVNGTLVEERCECGFGFVETINGDYCPDCTYLLGLAFQLGITSEDYGSIRVLRRLSFVEAYFNELIIAGDLAEADHNWIRGVWDCLDRIKKRRSLAGLPSVSRDRNWPN